MNLLKNCLYVSTAIFLLILGAGCSDRDPTGLEVARARIAPVVFDESLVEDDVYFQAFSGTYNNAVTIDSLYAYDGRYSIKVTVPGENSPLGAYAGGVLTCVSGRDLADYNALTFWARSSVPSALNVAGFGNDNTGTSLHEASRARIPLTTDWSFIVIPIPSSGKLIAERGLFTFAEGFEPLYPAGHEIWFDKIEFARLDNITDPFPVMPSAIKQYFIGSTASLSGTYTRYNIDGGFVLVNHSPNYFDYVSTEPSVAEIGSGVIRITGEGTSVVTASLDGQAANGTVTLTGFAPPASPAPSPSRAASNVISLFSDVYADVPVDTWNPNWGGSTTEDGVYAVQGDDTRMYSNLNFVGISFLSRTLDATAMTHLHLDVFAPQGTLFRVKLVTFDGDNGTLVDQKELPFDATTTPAFTAAEWSSLDIPLEDFNLVGARDHVGQIVLSTSDARLVLVDNLYFHR